MPTVLLPTSIIVARLGIEPNGRVSKFFTEDCAKHMDKYVPMDSGTLADYHIEGNYIIYNPKYAHYQYEGVSKNGYELNYSRDKHPLANHHWDERMKSAEMRDVVKEVQRFINRGGK